MIEDKLFKFMENRTNEMDYIKKVILEMLLALRGEEKLTKLKSTGRMNVKNRVFWKLGNTAILNNNEEYLWIGNVLSGAV